MHTRKHTGGPRRRNSKAILVLALVLLLGLAIGGTIAFLIDAEDPVINTFTPQQTSIEVHEDPFDNVTKKNVTIANTCKIPVYVRVKLVPTWENASGEPVGVAASLADLSITWGTSGKWVEFGGYYYYTEAVPAGTSTAALISQATVVTRNEYRMNLQVLAECIQADGEKTDGVKPVQDAWKVTIANGTVTAYSAG